MFHSVMTDPKYTYADRITEVASRLSTLASYGYMKSANGRLHLKLTKVYTLSISRLPCTSIRTLGHNFAQK